MSCLPPYRAKDGFSGEDDDENGHYILWLIDDLFDNLARAAIVFESASISLREFCGNQCCFVVLRGASCNGRHAVSC
jgi:hypothetical protein